MKTQIIQLEPHDNTISVKDKMGWSQTGRVLLIWPTRGQLLDRRLDLVLLQRHSRSLGVQIALVTRDSEVRFQARNLGIPVFKTIAGAQKSTWRRSRQRVHQPPIVDAADPERNDRIQDILANPMHRVREIRQLSPPYRILFFSLGVLAVLSIVAILLPSAHITLIPESRKQVIDLHVEANDDISEVKLTGTLPIRTINTVVEGRASIPTTGTVSVPFGYASGDVQFRNLTDKSITIPLGTVVSNGDGSQKFATQRAAHLAGGTDRVVLVPVEALKPGGGANFSAGLINIVEGDLGVSMTVSNPERMIGGSFSSSAAPAAQDRSLLREQLISTLEENALQEITTTLEDGDILLTKLPHLVEVIAEEYSPPDLQPANELELTLRLEFSVPYISYEDQEFLAKSVLDANLPEGFTPVPGTLTIERLSSRFTGKSMTSWPMQFSRFIRSQPAVNQAVNLSLGKSPESASQHLFDNMQLSFPPYIETSPSWWPVLPLLPLRIDVTAAGVNQGTTDHPISSQQ